MANVFSEANFEDEVLKSDIPVLVDFWATWCGPCRMIAPIIDQLSTELAGKIKVGKVDVDANNGLAATYGVRTIPHSSDYQGRGNHGYDGGSFFQGRYHAAFASVHVNHRTGLFIQTGLLRNLLRQAGFYRAALLEKDGWERIKKEWFAGGRFIFLGRTVMGEYITSVDSEQRGYSPPLFSLCDLSLPFCLSFQSAAFFPPLGARATWRRI